MLSFYLFLAFVAYILYRAVRQYLSFQRNLAAAKRSGIPYKIVPFYFLRRSWLVTHPLWFKLLRKLPAKYTTWVEYVVPDLSFKTRYDTYQKLGHDTFLTVSPKRVCMFTAEPAVISAITTRRNDFPKPTKLYKALNIYGRNVVSSEGALWRHQRKATSPPFTEKNNHLVWQETIDVSKDMLASWVGKDGKGGKTIDRIMDDTMRLSLFVISAAGFGRKLKWPAENTEVTADAGEVLPSKIKNEACDTDPGHSMSWTYALHCLLDTIILQFLLPKWLLAKLPFAMAKKAQTAFYEWGNYMSEAVSKKKSQVQEGGSNADTSMDILAGLVKGQLQDKDAKGLYPLSDAEILGNMFVLILAGHETTANSIHFAILFLALHIPSQRRLQQDLDQIFQGRPPSEWDYDRDLPQLFGGMTGAVLAEELRLMPPATNIPKSSFGVQDQPIMVGGKKCVVPKETYISLAVAAAHRNPNYWPAGPPTYPGGHPVHPASNLDNDLEEFRPERWLLNTDSTATTASNANGNANGNQPTAESMPTEKIDAEGIGVNESSDTSDRLFKPVKGSYVPFSEGYRACLGRRFAQVEVLAALAVIFQNYSVELAVDEYADDAQLNAMNADELADVWQQAAEDARDLMLNGCAVVITLQLRKGIVKVRFVPRGHERFADDVEERSLKSKMERAELNNSKTKTKFSRDSDGNPVPWTKDPGWRGWDLPEGMKWD